MDKQTLLKGITQPDERLLFSKVLDRLYLCSNRGEPEFTDFFDPVRVAGFTSLIRHGGFTDTKILIYGGAEGCERQMIGFSPDYIELHEDLFPINAINVSYNPKFSRSLGHRDFLGSIIGMGVDRGKIGDIIINEASAIVFAHTDIAGYICANLEKVGNTKVKAEFRDSDGLHVPQNGNEAQCTVSSLRLDAIISAVFHMSRGKSSELINAEKAYVNWLPVTDTSKQIREGDVITIRGYGRLRLLGVVGKTKKDRLSIKIIKY